MEQLKQTIFDMLTENTGTHMLDSGGDGGRMWQRNQGLTVETLERAPSASLEIYHSGRHGYSLEPTINVYHFLRDNLDLNKRCIEFNALPVRDWGGDVYGLSRDGQEWLENRGFKFGESFTPYNWESNLSQVLQFTYVQSPDWASTADRATQVAATTYYCKFTAALTFAADIPTQSYLLLIANILDMSHAGLVLNCRTLTPIRLICLQGLITTDI